MAPDLAYPLTGWLARESHTATGIVVWRGTQFVRAGGYRSPSGLVLFALGPIAALLFWSNALVFGSLAVYALALLVQLSVAIVSFYSLVSAANETK